MHLLPATKDPHRFEGGGDIPISNQVFLKERQIASELDRHAKASALFDKTEKKNNSDSSSIMHKTRWRSVEGSRETENSARAFGVGMVNYRVL